MMNDTTALDCVVGPEAATNRVQRANRGGGERQGVALEKGEGIPPAEGKGTFHRAKGYTAR